MHKFSKFYLYFGGVILITTAIGFTYMVLFAQHFGWQQWVAAIALAGTGAAFMVSGHYLSKDSY